MTAAHPVLVGDLGGTTTRFAVAVEHRLLDVRTWPTSETTTLRSGIDRYRGLTEQTWTAAAVAVAGPVQAGGARLTNATWSGTVAEFDCPGRFLNDLEAAAWGLDALGPTDAVRVHGPPADPVAPKVILGLGTGLGEAYRLQDLVIPGEGGHRRFAPDDAEQRQLDAHIRSVDGLDVIAEHVLSGAGLGRCLRFLREQRGRPGEQDPQALAREATQQPDHPDCRDAQLLYARCCAAEARGQALQVLARGGVWIVGGMAGRLPVDVWREAFASAYLDQGHHRDLLQELPVFVVDQPLLGLLGAGVAARAL